jgi:acetyl esterase/lipase
MKSTGKMSTARHFTILLIVMMVLSSAPLSAQERIRREKADPEWLSMMSEPRIVYQIAGMEQARVRKDIAYKDGDGEPLTFDLYTPSEEPADRKYPVVMLIHGGPVQPDLRTTPKDWGVFVSYGQLIAASGLAAVTFNHRFYAHEKVGVAATDVAALISYVRRNAAELNLDPDRLCLWAFSFGGLQLSPVIKDSPPFVRCLVSFYAFLDLPTTNLKPYSPLEQLKARTTPPAPIFIAWAGQDIPQLNTTVAAFVQEALSKNMLLELSTYPDGQHGFDMYNDTDESRRLIAQALAFVRTHLDGKSKEGK